MASFVFNRLALLSTDYVMGSSGSITPPSSWTVALATTATSGYNKSTSVWSATVSGANVNEIGSTTANGYARQTINRDQTGNGWGAATTDATGATTTGKQVTFTLSTGAPSPNGANSWVVTDGTTLNAGQLYFAADTAATRTFQTGDTEKVTPSLKGA
jgi:hypothetical protein